MISTTVREGSACSIPFREALDSAPRTAAGKPISNDNAINQRRPANGREAILDCQHDQPEAADILMVKPGLAYLDTIPSCDPATWLRQGGGGRQGPMGCRTH
jgi:porphobilinogen synthase